MTTYKDINYVRYGDKAKKTVVLLHGWGQNIEMMNPLGNNLNADVIVIDLPGFGHSKEPDKTLTIYDYADLIHKLLESLNIKKPIIVGHSFGGKITLAYACKYQTEKIVLLASPYKKEIAKPSFKTKILKAAKKIPGLKNIAELMKKYVGSTDYKNASPMMRKILVEHVNLDLTEDIKSIKVPTLIIWGSLDEAVDVKEAYEIEKLIEDSAVVIYEGCTHYAYLENLGRTINIINTFIN